MRTIFGILLSVIVIAVLGFMLLGYWAGSTDQRASEHSTATPVGTSGTNVETARERAAAMGEKAAIAAQTLRESVHEAGLTSKIKAKMALDDSVKALNINVTTVGSTVTLTGRVGSAAERERAIALARETDGVTRVVDNLELRN